MGLSFDVSLTNFISHWLVNPNRPNKVPYTLKITILVLSDFLVRFNWYNTLQDFDSTSLPCVDL